MVKTPCFHCRGTGSVPGRGTKILHATWCGKKKKKFLIVAYKVPHDVAPAGLTAYQPVFHLVSQTSQAFLTSEPLYVLFLVLEMLFLMAFLLPFFFIP